MVIANTRRCIAVAGMLVAMLSGDGQEEPHTYEIMHRREGSPVHYPLLLVGARLPVTGRIGSTHVLLLPCVRNDAAPSCAVHSIMCYHHIEAFTLSDGHI